LLSCYARKFTVISGCNASGQKVAGSLFDDPTAPPVAHFYLSPISARQTESSRQTESY